MSGGSKKLSLKDRGTIYLLFCHAFIGCDTFSSISGHGKITLFYKFCAGDIDEHMDIFLDMQATKNAVIRGGMPFLSIFTMQEVLHVLWEKLDTTCSSTRQQLG